MERSLAVQRAQRACVKWLSNGSEKINPISRNKISAPAELRQELAYVATTSVYTFRFGSDAPAETTALGNKLLGDNDVFACYAIRVLYGTDADQTIRVYRSRGITPSDDALYNGELKVDFESSNPVALLSTSEFRDETIFDGLNGLVLIEPLRIFTGKMSRANVVIDLGDISGITLTAAAYISVRLVGAIGRA